MILLQNGRTASALDQALKRVSQQEQLMGPDQIEDENRRRSFMIGASEAALNGIPSIEFMRDSVETARRQLDMGQEPQIRANLAMIQRDTEASAVYNNLDWSEFEETDMAEVIRDRIEAGGREAYSIERQYIETVSDVAATDEENVLDLEFEREQVDIKRSIIQSIIGDAAATKEERNAVIGLSEMVVLNSIPLLVSSTLGAEDGSEEESNVFDRIFPGGRLQGRNREFWRNFFEMDTGDFAEYAYNLDQELRDSATLGGIFNQTLYMELLEGVMGTAPSQTFVNSFAAIDNAPVVGAAAAGIRQARRVGFNPARDLVRSGSRNRASDLVTFTLEEAERTGLDAALTKGGFLSQEDLEATLLPKGFSFAGTTSEVGIGMDVAERMERSRQILRDAVEAGGGDLPSTRRLTPEEQQSATEAARRRLEDRVGGRPVRDVDYETVELSDGTSVRRVTAWVGRADGRGFASQETAARYANSIGLDDIEIRPDPDSPRGVTREQIGQLDTNDEFLEGDPRIIDAEARQMNFGLKIEEARARAFRDLSDQLGTETARRLQNSAAIQFVPALRVIRDFDADLPMIDELIDFFGRLDEEIIRAGGRPSNRLDLSRTANEIGAGDGATLGVAFSGFRDVNKDIFPGSVVYIARPDVRPLSRIDGRKTVLYTSGYTPETALHELIHAATGRMYNSNNPAFRQFQREIDQIFEAVIDDVDRLVKRLMSGDESLTALERELAAAMSFGNGNIFANGDELMAWGLTNKGAMDWLKTLPSVGARVRAAPGARGVRNQVVSKTVAKTPKNLWEDLWFRILRGFGKIPTETRRVVETVPTYDAGAEKIVQAQANRFEDLFETVQNQLRERNMALNFDERLRSGQLEVGQRGGTVRVVESKQRAPKARPVQDESGQWFIKVAMDVPETGHYSDLLRDKASNLASRRLLSARSTIDDDLLDAAVVGANRRTRIIESVIKPYERELRRLKGPERRTLAEIWQKGNNEARWFNQTEFESEYFKQTGVKPSERVWRAYQSTIEMNDIEHTLRNDALYKDKVTRGFETVTFDGLGISGNRVNARVGSELPSNEGVYDIASGTYYKPGELGELPEGWRVIKLDKPQITEQGHRLRTLVGPKNSFRIAPLRRDQLGYRAGGHRMYRGDRFVKQARRGVQPDGQQYWDNPITLIVGRTRAEVQEWADRMNIAREMLQDAEDITDPDLLRQIDETVFQGRAGFPSAREFVQQVEEGKLSLDLPFEALGDRQLPSAYNRRSPSDIDLVDEDTAGYESWLSSQNRMYYGRRGDEALPDWTGQTAPTLDMFEVMNRSLQNVANLSGLSDFKQEAMERWARTYGQYTDVREGASPAEVFVNGRINTNDTSIIQGAESSREAIRNILGWKSETTQELESLQRQIIDRIAGNTPGTNRAEFAAQASNWFRTRNPQAALTGAAFDLKLGLFNVAQLPLQISHMFAISALSPRHGARAWMNHIPARIFSVNGNESIIDTLIERGFHKAVGFDNPDEYRGFMRYLRSSGFTQVGGNQAMINEFGADAVFSGAGGSIRQTREAGRFFFNEAESWNRIMAQHVAWKEVREQFPNLEVGSPDFLRRVAGRADDYAFNMIRETGAYWQRGALAIPTQFWSYSARMLEAMLGNKFTRQQRLQLLLGQSFLYGTAGVPLGGFAWDYIEERLGVSKDQTSGTFRDSVERGFVDTAVREMTGVDVRIGERYGTGGFIETLIQQLMGEDDFGEVSAAEILGGATFSIWADIYEDSARAVEGIVRYAVAERNGSDVPFDNSHLQQLAMNISSVSNAMKAYMVHKHNIFYSSSGRALAEVDDAYAFSTMLSYQPDEVARLSDLFAYRENRAETIQEIANEITRYRQLMVNDPQNANDYAAQMQLFLNYQDPVYALEARQRALSSWDPNLNDSLTQSVQRLQVRDEASEITVDNNEEDN